MMRVVNRFRVPTSEAEEFHERLEQVRALLAAAAGFVDGGIARNLDDPELWLLHTTWAGVGAYRRALGSYDAKMVAVPLLSRAIDEPSAYEEVRAGVPLGELDRVIDEPRPRPSRDTDRG